jgi:hypothetical protein
MSNSFLDAVDDLSRKVIEGTSSGENFADVAFEVLSRTNLASLFSEQQLPALLNRHNEVNAGLPTDLGFSEEVFILFRNHAFSVEVYHWKERDTAIHDHSFEGTFQCLKGDNYQLEFQFDLVKSHCDDLDEGHLKRHATRSLRPGDSEKIKDKDQFIHCVAHAPSTYNICVRTRKSGVPLLRQYLITGLRYRFDKELCTNLKKLDLSATLDLKNWASKDLLHLLHLSRESSERDLRVEIDRILNKRYGISYLDGHEKTADFLSKVSVMSKKILITSL